MFKGCKSEETTSRLWIIGVVLGTLLAVLVILMILKILKKKERYVLIVEILLSMNMHYD